MNTNIQNDPNDRIGKGMKWRKLILGKRASKRSRLVMDSSSLLMSKTGTLPQKDSLVHTELDNVKQRDGDLSTVC